MCPSSSSSSYSYSSSSSTAQLPPRRSAGSRGGHHPLTLLDDEDGCGAGLALGHGSEKRLPSASPGCCCGCCFRPQPPPIAASGGAAAHARPMGPTAASALAAATAPPAAAAAALCFRSVAPVDAAAADAGALPRIDGRGRRTPRRLRPTCDIIGYESKKCDRESAGRARIGARTRGHYAPVPCRRPHCRLKMVGGGAWGMGCWALPFQVLLHRQAFIQGRVPHVYPTAAAWIGPQRKTKPRLWGVTGAGTGLIRSIRYVNRLVWGRASQKQSRAGTPRRGPTTF